MRDDRIGSHIGVGRGRCHRQCRWTGTEDHLGSRLCIGVGRACRSSHLDGHLFGSRLGPNDLDIHRSLYKLMRWEILFVVFCCIVGLMAVRRSRFEPQRDTQRMFTPAQASEIHSRCGHRCEHQALIGRRCSGPSEQADHVFPWSKGGMTIVSNGAGLCARHNRQKSNSVPSRFEMRRLARRRRRYFPPGSDRSVRWR